MYSVLDLWCSLLQSAHIVPYPDESRLFPAWAAALLPPLATQVAELMSTAAGHVVAPVLKGYKVPDSEREGNDQEQLRRRRSAITKEVQ
jgi:hypothetical protein